MTAALALVRVCDYCGAPNAKRASLHTPAGWVYELRCAECQGKHFRRAAAAGAIVHPSLRYEDDVACQLLVNAHPDGLTLDEVGRALGLTRERVRQIEAAALAKLRRRLAVLGFLLEEFCA